MISVPREMTIQEMIFLLKEKGYIVKHKSDFHKLSFSRIKDKRWSEDFDDQALHNIREQINHNHISTSKRTLDVEVPVEIEQSILYILKNL